MHMTRTDSRPLAGRGRTAARLLGAAALLTLAACGGGDDADEPRAASLPEGVSPIAAGKRMAMPAAESPSCQPAPMRKVFRMEAEWNGFWEYGFPVEGCPRPQLPPGFDWNKEMIILAAMGRRASAADSIQVRGSGVVGDSVLVVLRRTTRQDGCTEPRVRTWPRDLVRIPADTLPVRFVEEQRRLPCPGQEAAATKED
jgi:hypothetical protein